MSISIFLIAFVLGFALTVFGPGVLDHLKTKTKMITSKASGDRKGAVTLSTASDSVAGKGDVSYSVFELESGHATVLKLLRDHGDLEVGPLMDLMGETEDRWHVIVYTTVVARVAYPDVKPIDYLIGELLQNNLTSIQGLSQSLTPQGLESLQEWERLNSQEMGEEFVA